MTSTNGNATALEQAIDRLNREVRDGLRHGFFELTLACEIVKGGKRCLTLKAGKSHRFTIPEDDLQ